VDWAVPAVSSGAHPANAADFDSGVLPSGTLNFGIGVLTQTITINVAGDTTVETDETFDVVLSNPLPDGAINVGTATATIVNDDTGLFLTADQSSKAEGNSGSTAFTFTVTRSGLLTGTSDVNWSVTGSPIDGADTIDFVGGAPFPSGTLHFAATDVTKTITVNVQGDTAFEANEGFTVTLDSPVGAQILGNGVVTATILNDDFQALTAGDVAITGINGTNPDQFMFVPLVDLQPNASIIFTDDAWDGTALRTNEGAITYTAPGSGLPKGSVVEIQVATNGDPSVVVGNGTAAASGAGTFSLVSGGENILAYIGLSTAPTFLFAVTTDDSYLTTGSPSTSQTYLPPGLVVGTSAVAPLDTAVNAAPDVANAQYNTGHGLSGSPDQLRALIADSANWDIDPASNAAGEHPFSFDTTNYTVTAPTATGDYNHNHVVDAADYTVWRDHLGQHVTAFSDADGSGNGIIDQADYTFWLNHFGNSVPGAGAGSEATVGVAQVAEIASAPVAAALVVTTTPVESSPIVASSTVASTTPTAHEHAFAALVDSPVAAAHHAGSGFGSASVGGNYRSAWLHDLLLTTAGGVKSFGSSTSSHHAGSTTDSGDADATDECFASLGGDKVASAM
jgi:Calx-beta domain